MKWFEVLKIYPQYCFRWRFSWSPLLCSTTLSWTVDKQIFTSVFCEHLPRYWSREMIGETILKELAIFSGRVTWNQYPQPGQGSPSSVKKESTFWKKGERQGARYTGTSKPNTLNVVLNVLIFHCKCNFSFGENPFWDQISLFMFLSTSCHYFFKIIPQAKKKRKKKSLTFPYLMSTNKSSQLRWRGSGGALLLEKRHSFKIHLEVVSGMGFCWGPDQAKTLSERPSNAWWEAGSQGTRTFLRQVSSWRLKTPVIRFSILRHIPHPVQRPGETSLHTFWRSSLAGTKRSGCKIF